MRMNDSDTKFDPQVMALAMPTDSPFTKGAEGISNIGKVFLDADARVEASKLNALKMEEASQSIIGKQNENSIFGEKQERERTNYVLDKRTKLFDGLKKENEYNAEVKKVEESGLMEKLKGVLATTMFFKEGKIDIPTFNTSRDEFLKRPEWKGKEHIVNAMFDSKLDEMTKVQEAQLKNGKTQADIDNKVEETRFIAPKANAYIATQGSVVTKNNAGARLDNVNADLAPQKVQIQRDQETRLNKTTPKSSSTEDKLKDDRMKITADETKMSSMIPNYAELHPNQKLEINRIYVDTGVIPNKFQDKDGELQAVYPKGTLTPKVQAPARSEYSDGTVIKNAQGVTMVMRNGKWTKQ